MCVIIHKPAGVKISSDVLRKCWNDNPHGAGFMFAHRGKLKILKGFLRLRSLKAALFLNKWIDRELIIHFRYATHGLICEEQTHPFVVKDRRYGVVHNGIINFADPKFNLHEQSDTYSFCRHFIEKLPDNFEKNEGIRNLLNEYLIHHHSVLLVMNKNGRTSKFGLVDGYNKHNCWFSNDLWDKVVYANSIKRLPACQVHEVSDDWRLPQEPIVWLRK